MNTFTSTELSKGIFVRDFTNQKFKTMRVSVNMIFPLKAEIVSTAALIPAVLTRSTKEFPDMTILSKHLAQLYGASLDCCVTKIGDNQVISISAGGIASKYALDGESMAKQLTSLVCSSIFNPLTDEQGFVLSESFRQEKRQLAEIIDSDFNDKRTLAKSRLIEIMHSGEPAGILRYGNKESVNKIERQQVLVLLKEILKTARIEIFALGDCDFNEVIGILKENFVFDRSPVGVESSVVLRADKVREKVETQAIAQSKLVMGFRTGVEKEESASAKLLCTLFGGSPSSKLFVNVREKLSLCYYCLASININKGVIVVESGVETKNVEKAKLAILEQIEDIKNGNFSDDDISFAKLYMINSYKGVADSLGATENYYISQVLNEKIKAPEETAKSIEAVTREEIINAAKKLSLDTVFVLKGEQADE